MSGKTEKLFSSVLFLSICYSSLNVHVVAYHDTHSLVILCFFMQDATVKCTCSRSMAEGPTPPTQLFDFTAPLLFQLHVFMLPCCYNRFHSEGV